MLTQRIAPPIKIAAALLLTLAALTPLSTHDESIAGAPSTVCGDSDGNRIVNSIDVAIVLQYSAGHIQTLAYEANDDVDSSASVDARDAVLILQVSARRLHIEDLNCS
jgi:hypothetical protein